MDHLSTRAKSLADENRPRVMPFGDAMVLTLVGIGLLGFALLGWVGPAAWVRFGYLPATAVVRETRSIEIHSKGGHYTKLEVRLNVAVEDRTIEAWVTLPLTTRQRQRPEAEAVQRQLIEGQRVPCFRDPFARKGGIVLERTQLAWGMLYFSIFSSLFLLVGLAGISSSWTQTFPSGLVVAMREYWRKMPRQFHRLVLSVFVALAAGWSMLALAGGSSSTLAPFLIIITIAALLFLYRRAVHHGSVGSHDPTNSRSG